MGVIRVPITDDLARDVKDLNFGFGGDISYEVCHRGDLDLCGG
mgnify:CR=1 FL=1